ncbi:MAG: ABC transporter ATP-binding protein [Proteobacteria bacterium]|nr:ABC transporter ATP-binding protein [Pseudomonadota bacterium]
MNTSAVIEAKGLRKSHSRGDKAVEILRGIDLVIKAGETVAIMGPSGAGKTTLLQILGALNLPDNGFVKILGQDTTGLSDSSLSALRRRQLGFIFQSFNLLPSLTAVENVAWPLLLDGKNISESEDRARALLDQVSLGHRSHHRPTELSGGEQQRVAIARALVASPRLLFADEPTGALDSKTGAMVLELLLSLKNSTGASLVIVTHDHGVAKSCDRIIHLIDGRVAT